MWVFRRAVTLGTLPTMSPLSEARIKELSNLARAAKTQEDITQVGTEIRTALGEQIFVAKELLTDRASILALLEKLSREPR